jgi:hypothetical protein
VLERCLHDLDCGHPVSQWLSEDQPGRNYRYLQQQFEGGRVRLVIDFTYPLTLEGLFLRNRDNDVWFPLR